MALSPHAAEKPQPIPGFQVFKTDHCVTGAMRHVYEFHGYPISEDLLLGLGAGVGFVYWHMKGAPPLYGGRANVGRPGEDGLEKRAGKRTGVQVESFHTASATKAERAMIDMLAADKPVMIQVDMGFLPYLHLPEGYHFGGHVIAIAGYDADAKLALAADRDGEIHPISMQALTQARNSTYKPFPPRNTWFTFDFSAKRAPQPDEVWQAIDEVTEGMLNPPIANLGVKGIRTATSRTRQWAKEMCAEELRANCFNIFIFIDATGGTGGGIFRYMYGRFLQEAAAITGKQELAKAGDDMHAIGDQWQEIAQIFKQASESTDPIPGIEAATSRMALIADNEQMIWESLQNMH
jgi:Domain of unknown function (DUF4872)/Butirosin biosynthesis protein H, N-terminal